MAHESRGAVLAAMGANAAIATGKLATGVITGSAAMLAEAGHSFADTVNQVFLLVGINLSETSADEDHPHGYGKEAFFWSFLAAIFIFVAGAAFSFYEGVRTFLHENGHERSTGELTAAYGVLAVAFVFEGFSWTVAIRGTLAAARRRGWPVGRFVWRAPDLTIKTVLFEDSAALVGLVLAAAGLTLSEATGTESWDGAASLSIGVVLTTVAFMLGMQSRDLLLGAAADEQTRAAISKVLGEFPEVERAIKVLTMQLGANSVLVTGELQVRAGLSAVEVEDLMQRVDERLRSETPSVQQTFWELHRIPA